jgi:hypothetical protein
MLSPPKKLPKSSEMLAAYRGDAALRRTASMPGPMLTYASLKAWACEPGLADLEREQRRATAKIIAHAARPVPYASTLSTRLVIAGDLNLRGLTALTQLPAGLVICGSLNCSDCCSLTSLPAGLRIGHSLDCHNCFELKHLSEGLRLGGNLDCSECPSLTQLPEGLCVGGSLDCTDCFALTHLPEGLKVGDGLFCSGCSGLTRLAEQMRLGGHLFCGGCTSLTQLPQQLHVSGDFDCSDCIGLTQLPDDLVVVGGLYCSGCTGLTHLTNKMSVGTNLTCAGCTSLTRLPERLHVAGDFDCSDCTALTQLPEWLSVEGSLDCRDCTALTHFSPWLLVEDNIDCSGCVALVHLPYHLSLKGAFDCSNCTSLVHLSRWLNVHSLYCNGCTNLEELPAQLRVDGDLDCDNCPGLMRLPDGLWVGGELLCHNNPSLTALPQGLFVGGDLDCSDCTHLTQLPRGLCVVGHLDCRDCTSLNQLHQGLSIGGNIDFRGCVELSTLPDDMAAWGHRADGQIRHVHLLGSGISPNAQRRFGVAQMPGMHLDFVIESIEPIDDRFGDLNAAAGFWYSQVAERAAPDFGTWTDLLVRDRELLRQFLGRLCDTADYQHVAARTRLAGRVCDVLEAMGNSPKLRQICSDSISDALQSCGDRVMWVMNQVEIAVRIHTAQQQSHDGTALKALVLGFMRLEIVQAHARQKVGTLKRVDEIEVYLAYESGLREALALPVSAENMLFASCADVSRANLETARLAAQAAMQDPERVAAYLQTSAVWQRQLRQQAAQQWSWDAVAPKSFDADFEVQKMQCPIEQEYFAELKEPVLSPSSGSWILYEAQSLLVHWVECGTDVFNQKLELTDLRRPAARIQERSAKRQRLADN